MAKNSTKVKAKKPAKKQRRKRVDSFAEKAKIVQAATKQLEIPSTVELGEKGEVFFEEILEECAKVYWTKHRLTFAAQLASLMELAERMKAEVESDGYTITNTTERGHTTVKHPLLGEISKLTAAIIAGRRSLALHAIGQHGDGQEAGKHLARQKREEAAALGNGNDHQAGGQLEDDSLIMRPRITN